MQQGDYYQHNKIPAQHGCYICNTGAQHFADADFFCSFLRGIHAEAKQPPAGNENSNAHRHIYQPCRFCLLAVKPYNRLVQKIIVEGRFRIYFFPFVFLK